MENLFFDKSQEILSTKGNLPHWNQDGKMYFVTFRLADSMPQGRLKEFLLERDCWLRTHPKPWSESTEAEFHYRFSQYVDKWLDAGYGSCILRKPGVADIVAGSICFEEGVKHIVHSYVVMPNHVHVLDEVIEGFKIQSLMHSWKSYSAHEINRTLDRRGQVWEHESFDRIIRDKLHYLKVIDYIANNVKHGGVKWYVPDVSGVERNE